MELSSEILSNLTVFMKYAKYLPELGRRETWDDLVTRNKVMHMKKYPQIKSEIEEQYKFVYDKKVLPSMRSLQFGGKPIELSPNRLFNCFGEETSFITNIGVKAFKDLQDGETVQVLTHKGNWKPSTVHNYGKQQLYRITLHRGKSKKTIRATKNHRWLLRSGAETTNLKVGDILHESPKVWKNFNFEKADFFEKLYWCYGYVYGDGTVQKTGHSFVRLCDKDRTFSERFEEMGFKTSQPLSCQGDFFAFIGTYQKTAPNPEVDSLSLLQAFAAGYLDADGSRNPDWYRNQNLCSHKGIQSSQKDHFDFIEKVFETCGLYIITKTDLTGQETNYGIRPETYKYSISSKIGTQASSSWVVKSIEEDEIEDVWCLEVEDDHSFVLSGGIVTGNCSYCPIESWEIFSEIMFLLLGGSGVGYSVQRHHVKQLPEVKARLKRNRRFLIGDSIEGWADAIKILTKSYFFGQSQVIFDYSDIRPKGRPLITSGGKAPGPQPLKDCIHNLTKIFESKEPGTKLTPLECHDMLCHIADAVLSGGIRRAALISLFSVDDEEMLTCKYQNWEETNPQRGRANNSALILRHKIKEPKFKELWRVIENSRTGEPGLVFTNDREWGSNPCVEIALRPYQFCNLTTINSSNLADQSDFNARAKAASFIGTLQAGYTDFHYLRDVWRRNTERDALLGVSMTGIASGSVLNLNLTEATNIILEENKRVSDLIGIKQASRTTCVKPEGCLSSESMISMKEGILSLDEIMPEIEQDTQWYSHDFTVNTENEQKHSPKFFCNGKKQVYKITTSGGLEFHATSNHKFRILHECGEYGWTKVSDLKIDTCIPYSVGEYKANNCGSEQKLNSVTFEVSKYAGRLNSISQPTYLDEDLAWFLGLYFADGSNHSKGIRISGNIEEKKGFDRASRIAAEKFGIYSKVHKTQKDSTDKRVQLYFNSVQLRPWLASNGIEKGKSKDIEIPKVIRQSPSNIIEAFVDGYSCGDGCDKSRTRSWSTTSFRMSQQLVTVLRAIGVDCKTRPMPPTDSSYGTGVRYWVQERKGRSGEESKQKRALRQSWAHLDKIGLSHMSVDTIVAISIEEKETYDINVSETHQYLANSYVSHNTSSLVVGSSSGIHAWHAPYYIRRIRVLKNEPIYIYMKEKIPELVEDDFFAKTTQAVISIPIKAPDGASFSTEPALDLLERVKKVSTEWVHPGHRDGENTHNVSATISIGDDEWEEVGDWMWNNRAAYNGLSVLPRDGGTYIQSPFEEINKEKYEEMYKHLTAIDLTEVVESKDNTSLRDQAACAGGQCEIM